MTLFFLFLFYVPSVFIFVRAFFFFQSQLFQGRKVFDIPGSGYTAGVPVVRFKISALSKPLKFIAKILSCPAPSSPPSARVPV